jgi:hypothetical protein
MCSAQADVRFTPKADVCTALGNVRFVPKADIVIAIRVKEKTPTHWPGLCLFFSWKSTHSITSSARIDSACGSSTPTLWQSERKLGRLFDRKITRGVIQFYGFFSPL